MSLFDEVLWPGGKFLGIEWHPWKVVGWAGNAVFTSRFLVQWYATEKQGRVVVPSLFWWFSLGGALLLLSYAALYQRDSVFVAAYAFSWIPYLRNLLIHHRTERDRPRCASCASMGTVGDRYCARCGSVHTGPGSEEPNQSSAST
jgi:lipid-A-disaccharide synthase-like uncharacterized protein